MNDEEHLAEKISGETPWWAKAPVWLAAGIVGVPSFIAIMAGYYLAQNVTYRLKLLETYDLSIMTQVNGVDNKLDKDVKSIQGFMRAALRAAQQGCLNNAKTVEDQHKCVQVPDPPDPPTSRRREDGSSLP